MKLQTKTIAKFLYPVSLLPEESVVEVRDEAEALQKAFDDPSIFAFSVGTQTYVHTGDETLYGKPKFGGVAYFGDVFTLNELQAKKMAKGIISTLKDHGYLFVVRTRCSLWKPVANGDKVYDQKNGRLILEISPQGEPTLAAAPATHDQSVS